MIWLELCTTYSSSSPVVTTSSIILCFNEHLLTRVHLEKWPLKWRERERAPISPDFPSMLRLCWLGDRKSIWPVKNWVLVCWWWFDRIFACLIAPAVTTTSITLSSNKSRMETFWYRLNPAHLENGRQNGQPIFQR